MALSNIELASQNCTALTLNPVNHPQYLVQQQDVAVTSDYFELCWTPFLGPASVLLLRRCVNLAPVGPVDVATVDLAMSLGLATRGAPSRPFWRTIERICSFEFARWHNDGPTLDIYLQVPLLNAARLAKAPVTTRLAHQTHIEQQRVKLAGPQAFL